MRTQVTRLVTAAFAFALVTSACSSSSTSSNTTGPGAGATTSTPNPNNPAINQWAITYTGGKLQKASGSPIDIGYVNGLGRHEIIPIPFNQARILSSLSLLLPQSGIVRSSSLKKAES